MRTVLIVAAISILPLTTQAEPAQCETHLSEGEGTSTCGELTVWVGLLDVAGAQARYDNMQIPRDSHTCVDARGHRGGLCTRSLRPGRLAHQDAVSLSVPLWRAGARPRPLAYSCESLAPGEGFRDLECVRRVLALAKQVVEANPRRADWRVNLRSGAPATIVTTEGHRQTAEAYGPGGLVKIQAISDGDEVRWQTTELIDRDNNGIYDQRMTYTFDRRLPVKRCGHTVMEVLRSGGQWKVVRDDWGALEEGSG